MNIINHLQYNSKVILSYFFICIIVLIINKITSNSSNNYLFSSSRGNILNPLTYVRLFTHIFGHSNFLHFRNNFLIILLIGPMIEEKYGSINLLIMIITTSLITGIINLILTKNRILGSSGIAFMLILLSSLVNIEAGKIPLTLILICIFYIAGEIIEGIFKKDNISHMSHLIGAICGFIFGFYLF